MLFRVHGRWHSTKNSGAIFRKFPWANGSLSCVEDDNCSLAIFQWLLGLIHKYRSRQNSDKSTSWLFIHHNSRDLAQTTTAAETSQNKGFEESNIWSAIFPLFLSLKGSYAWQASGARSRQNKIGQNDCRCCCWCDLFVNSFYDFTFSTRRSQKDNFQVSSFSQVRLHSTFFPGASLVVIKGQNYPRHGRAR